MSDIRAIFFDVGGVLLTNGWDTQARKKASERFGLDWEELQERHELISSDFEKGRLSLDQYLACTVFHRERKFSADSFRAFMFEQSQELGNSLHLLQSLAEGGEYRLLTLNNESLELNLHRIETFQLRQYFSSFFSSCFLGVKKPQPEIYRIALQVTQEPAGRCIYIDDRELNLENASQLGMQTVHFQSLEQLREALSRHGVNPEN